MKMSIRIDPTRCRGHGICALFYSEGIDLDQWGFGRPREPDDQEEADLVRARRAIRACPNEAISLVPLERIATGAKPG